MPFKKGQPRPVGAGRKKGSPNKRNTIFESLEEIVTEDGQPLDIVKVLMAEIMDKNMAPYERAQLLLEFMQFVYPKQKIMEFKLGDDEFKQALVQRILQLNDRTRIIDAK